MELELLALPYLPCCPFTFQQELLEESNALLEKMSTENGRNDTPMV